jgi:DNA-binding transcriptional LysR family regulator
MQLRQLRYFCVVAECENITNAANSLFISQPSVSKEISNLEKELGVQLFNKSGRNIVLNEKGHLFYNSVKSGINMIDEGVRMLQKETIVKLRICSILSIAVCSDIYAKFMHEYPQANICFEPIPSEKQCEPDNFDIIIAGMSNKFDNMPNTVLLEEPLIMVVPYNHDLAEYDEINISQAKPYPFIIRDKTIPLSILTMQVCKKAGFVPKIAHECRDIQMFIALVNMGNGIALVPEKTVANFLNLKGKQVCIKGADGLQIQTHIKMYYKKSNIANSAISLFRDYMIKYFESLTK